jgi:FemAB-related protein (PEP-CTERM system-associated)
MTIEVSLYCKDGGTWDYYVENSPRGSVFQLYGWKNIIQESYGHTPYYLAASREGNIVGVLPLYMVQVPFLGSSLVSSPYLDYAGICTETEDIRNSLLKKAVGLSQEKEVQHLNIRELSQERWPGLVTNLDKVTMELELDPEVDKLWEKIPSKRRNCVRKAEKAGLKVEVCGLERLEDFYRIYSINMRDLGSPAHSSLFFQKVFNHLPDNIHLFLVQRGTEVIGAAACLKFRDSFTIPWASSLRDYFSLCPNDILYWEVLKWGALNGYRTFDFGRSTVGSGTYEFKKLWGCNPRQIYWQYIVFNGREAPKADLKQGNFSSLAIRAWQNLPLPLANTLGPILRRYISN